MSAQRAVRRGTGATPVRAAPQRRRGVRPAWGTPPHTHTHTHEATVVAAAAPTLAPVVLCCNEGTHTRAARRRAVVWWVVRVGGPRWLWARWGFELRSGRVSAHAHCAARLNVVASCGVCASSNSVQPPVPAAPAAARHGHTYRHSLSPPVTARLVRRLSLAQACVCARARSGVLARRHTDIDAGPCELRAYAVVVSCRQHWLVRVCVSCRRARCVSISLSTRL